MNMFKFKCKFVEWNNSNLMNQKIFKETISCLFCLFNWFITSKRKQTIN
jgi:hypothetical protein